MTDQRGFDVTHPIGRRHRRLAMGCRIAAAFFVCGFLSIPAAAQSVRLAYLFSDGNLAGTLQAYKVLLDEQPHLRAQVSLSFLTESMFDDAGARKISGADVLILDTMNQEMLDRFNSTHGVDLIGSVSERGIVYAVGEGLMPREHYIGQGAVWDERASRILGQLGVE